MGNEHSHLGGIEIEEKAVEVSQFWSLYSANITNTENTTDVSLLIGELFVEGHLWTNHTPLEKNSKHLKIYRHPCILKYISSWTKSSKFYLAVEEVVPLSHVLDQQNSLQICLGLHSILKALCFLHEKALVSHNNICMAAIYATKDGGWKLGGMEYACKFSDLTSDYLKKLINNGHNIYTVANEEKSIQGSPRKDFLDIFAYGALVCEVLKSKTDEEIPSLSSFRELCKNHLQQININSRPKLSSLLDHEFFNHEFITIHSFLVELPLKSDEEKTLFFHSLRDRLKPFQEATTASQLGNLLLSRLVLLNKTAQDEVLPFVLCPREEPEDHKGNIFSEDTFRKFLVPKLLEIFCVRDAQIRLLLLDHFKNFVHTFTKEELKSCILPELLVGVKDTNDHLVALTLRTLADLVPVLGAATVIGGKRAKLFNDGRPINHPHRSLKISKPLQAAPEVINSIIQTSQVIMNLPERSRPDGEEGETSTEEGEQSVAEDLDHWEDWDVNEGNYVIPLGTVQTLQQDNGEATSLNTNSNDSVATVHEIQDVSDNLKKESLPNISELDAKNQTNSEQCDDFDFFKDMEPIIETSSKFLINDEKVLSTNSKLILNVSEDMNEDGWVDEEWE